MDSIKEDRIKKRYEKDKRTFENSTRISQKNKELVDRYLRDATNNRKNKKNYPYSYNSTRYTIMKKICEDAFPNKNLDQVTQEDIIEFEEKIQKGIMGNTSRGEQKPYSDSYKARFGKTLMEFYKYFFGRDKEAFNALVLNDFGNKILTTDYERYKKKPVLRIEHIDKIIKSAEPKEFMNMLYFGVLFDGGFRIEEFLNLRFSDIIEKEGEKQNYFIFNVTIGTKTGKPRSVPLFLYYNLIKEYIEIEQTKKNYSPSNYFYPKSPQWCNKMMKRMILRYLGEYVEGNHYSAYSNHSQRHSSATHYALNVAKREAAIYNRYGWVFGSDEAREYVQLIAARDEEEEKLFRQSSVASETREIKSKMNKLTEELDRLREENSKLKKVKKTAPHITYQLITN